MLCSDLRRQVTVAQEPLPCLLLSCCVTWASAYPCVGCKQDHFEKEVILESKPLMLYAHCEIAEFVWN